MNGKTCFVALHAAPWRRELYMVAGKMTGALMSLVDSRVQETTKREYSMSGATIVYRGAMHAAPDKNAQVMQKTSLSTMAAPAAWRRLGSWSTRTGQPSFGAGEPSKLGVTQGELEERAKSMRKVPRPQRIR